MILSHDHRFIFIKGKKVGGTSAEIALSQMCGPRDIVTPISPVDERYRLGTTGEPRNYTVSLYPSFVRSRLERRYVGKIRSAGAGRLGSIRHPRGRFSNHMPLADVLKLVPQARDYDVIYVERSPYSKVMSLANWRAHSRDYSAGRALARSADAISDAVDSLISNGTIRNVLNIDRYRGVDGRIRGHCWKTASLAEDLSDFFRSRGLEASPIVHAKRGFGSDGLDPATVLRPDQITLINDLFREEFETFGWPKITPASH